MEFTPGYSPLPEVVPHILTVGKLRSLIKDTDPDMPVAFTNWSDGIAHMVEYLEVRKIDESAQIFSRDMADDYPSAMSVLVLSKLG